VGRLQNLVLSEITAKPVVHPERFLLQFLVEQIQKLTIYGVIERFFKLSHRFAGLKSLHLLKLIGSTLSFPGALFPSLVELHTRGFNSAQLSGMTGLRHLKITHTE
jgi:hypothetical protein